MRIKVDLISLDKGVYNLVTGYIIQGFIYNLLQNTKFAWLHSYRGFKPFSFSNVFPRRDFVPEERYSFIFASPNKELVNTIYSRLRELVGKEISFGQLRFELKKVRKFDLPLKFPWKVETPIILRAYKRVIISDGSTHYYVDLDRAKILEKLGFKKYKLKLDNIIPKKISLEELKYLDKKRFRVIDIKDVYYDSKNFVLFDFLEKLKHNSIAKYNEFTGMQFQLDKPLFEHLKYKGEKTVKMRIKGRGDALFKGLVFDELNVLRRLNNEERKFYKFLMDAGLGNLTSLGFGFVNPKSL